MIINQQCIHVVSGIYEWANQQLDMIVKDVPEVNAAAAFYEAGLEGDSKERYFHSLQSSAWKARTYDLYTKLFKKLEPHLDEIESLLELYHRDSSTFYTNFNGLENCEMVLEKRQNFMRMFQVFIAMDIPIQELKSEAAVKTYDRIRKMKEKHSL